MKRYLKLLVPYLFFAFICVCLTPRSLQNDTFYLIKLGDGLWNFGADFKDHYTYLADLTYSYPHFLFNLLCYGAYAAFSFFGIYALSILLYFLFAASLFYILKSSLKSSRVPFSRNVLPFLLTLLVVVLMTSFVTARSQVLTYTFFLWELFFLEKLLVEKSSRTLWKYTFLIPLLSWLVAMNHATIWPFFFILFFPVFAELFLWKILRNSFMYKNRSSLTALRSKFFLGKETTSPRKKNLKFLFLSLLFSVLVGFLTPSRICFTATFKIMQGTTQSYISEHAPLVLISHPEALVFFLIFWLVLAFTNSRLRPRDFFLFLGLSAMTFLSLRHIALLLCLGVFPLSRLLENLSTGINPKFFEGIEKFTPKRLALFAVSFLTIIAFFDSLDDPYLIPAIAPTAAVRFLKTRYASNLDGLNLNETRAVSLKNPLRIYNEYNVGAYLLFEDIPVSMDSRVNIYTTPFSKNLESDLFDDYQSIRLGNSKAFDLIESYGFNVFLLYKDNSLASALARDDGFLCVFSDDNFVIYEKLSQ